MNAVPAWARDILAFWFAELTPKDWFRKDDALDAAMRARFLADWEGRQREPADSFMGNGDTALAAVILFDQFARNMFRDDPRAFACDPLARAIADAAIARGFDGDYEESERQFFYMPFMHSEDLADQDRSLALFGTFSGSDSLGYARAHRAVIERFGRFPHRNAVLGRETTDEEKAAIESGAIW